ncbi:hypothetical protein I316_05301 [Kwoniella heveanensis BCC8398]|uniref:Uncharacterized protein n=1 Tax=Kwoniella heveanensis BCC8398 TaxID=1296120 RepID=A0A1B9GPM9_9TREE|nr:hypothetical protein I316_05301 [Kwoniella heveanensis BCC8398]
MSLPASSPLPKAIKLVHTILSSSSAATTNSSKGVGLTTKEIIREAIKAYQAENPSASALASASTSAHSATNEEPQTTGKGKGKGKGKVVVGHGQKKNLGVNVVPDGHPFVSSTYLKTRVLAVLKSQNLISKSIRRAPVAVAVSDPSSSASASASASTSTFTATSGGAGAAAAAGRPTYTWKLNDNLPFTSSTSDLPVWDKSAHWARLIAGEAPGKLHAELSELFVLRKAELKEQAFESKKARRSEREIWEWDGRADGLTTRLERIHLNKRRAEARPKKERRRIEAYERFVDGLEAGAGVEGSQQAEAGQRMTV